MVLYRTNDAVLEGFSPSAKLRFLYTDVTESTTQLVRAHGYSPGAALTLGSALASAAALSLDQGDAEETLHLESEFSGPAGGYHTEVDGNGHLRGYVFEKNPERFLRNSALPQEVKNPFLGSARGARLTRIRNNGIVRSQISFLPDKPEVEQIVTEVLSMQAQAEAVLSANLYDDGIDRVRLLAMQRLPDSSGAEFKRLRELFRDGTVGEMLSTDSTLYAVRDVLGLEDLITGPTRSLSMGCSCSREKILNAYKDEPPEVLQGWIRRNTPRIFRCHLCGKEYETPVQTIASLLRSQE